MSMSKLQFLRTVDRNGESHGGFVWPLTVGAVVEAPDWNPSPTCGGGLHAIDPATGDWSLMDWSIDARGMIVEVDESDVVTIDAAKVKFPRCTIIKVTEPGGMYDLLCRLTCSAEAIAKMPDASSGDYASIGSSGHYARIGSSGYYASIGSSGDYASIGSSGHCARIGSSGDAARIGGSGDDARIGSSGDDARIGSSGDYASIEATGADSVILAAHGATVKAGERGVFAVAWHDGKRNRIAVGYVGEDGIKPLTWYTVNAKGEFVEAT